MIAAGYVTKKYDQRYAVDIFLQFVGDPHNERQYGNKKEPGFFIRYGR